MSGDTIDVHELAAARVTPFHWRLGAMMGALTLFDGYDTFNPAYPRVQRGGKALVAAAFLSH
jgi:AAHS family 4-hydroxybenzoate transporter-like MFS transporter